MRAGEVALLRLAAQGLAGPPAATPGDAVRHLLAVQGQDLPGALLSVALRSAGDVAAALGGGEVVRSWSMRGTLHLVAAEDLGWLLALTGERQRAAAAARRRSLGLGPEVVDRAGEVAAGVLQDGPRSREDLQAAWAAAGLPASGSHGSHLLAHLAQDGLLCLGPLEGRRQQVVLLDAWVGTPRRLGREEALAELALRYFTSHGPATEHDLARWAGLPLGAVRSGAAAVRDRLEAVDVDGTPHLMDPAAPDRLAAVRRRAAGVHLLPGFDELLLGYADRTPTLPPAHADRVVPGGNGVFRPTVVHRGRVVATWRTAGARRALALDAFEPPLAEAVRRGAERAHAALPVRS